MYCRKCDKSLPSDSTFCPYCGNEKLEAEENAAEGMEETACDTEPKAVAKDGDKAVEGKSGKGLVIGILAAVVILLAVAVAFLAGRLFGGEDVPVTTDDAAQTGDVTTTGTVDENAELFPNDYVVVYPDGMDYASLDLTKYVELGEYEGLTITLTTSSEITDADLEEYIASLLAQHADEVDVTDRAAETGDIVNIDYVGYVDGEAFNGGTASGQTLTIGAGGYIDGFENGIVGMTAGETKTIDVSFPEDYLNTSLAGKDAQFDITLNSISVLVEPEYNDAFVRSISDFDTLPAFEADAREILKEERAATILAEKQAGVLSAAVENAKVVEYPEGLVEDYMYQQIDSTKYYGAMYYGMEYSEFLKLAVGMTAAEYEAEVRKSAALAVKQEMVVYAIFNDAGLTVSDEARAEAEQYYLDYYESEDLATLCQNLGVSEQYFNNTIDFSTVYTEVVDYLTENATFTGAK